MLNVFISPNAGVEYPVASGKWKVAKDGKGWHRHTRRFSYMFRPIEDP
jgi:hypothetical protein